MGAVSSCSIIPVALPQGREEDTIMRKDNKQQLMEGTFSKKLQRQFHKEEDSKGMQFLNWALLDSFNNQGKALIDDTSLA